METYLSRIEAILNGEDIKPLSRVEELLKEYGGDGYDETYNTDEDKIKNDAFMLHKDTNFIFTEVGISEPYEEPRVLQYKWDFTKSLTDEIQGKVAELRCASGKTLPQRTSDGVIFNEPTQAINFGNGFIARGHTFEYDVGYAHFEGVTAHVRHLMLADMFGGSAFGNSPFIFRAGAGADYIGWSMYGYASDSGSSRKWGEIWGDLKGWGQIDCISGKTVKIVISNDGNTTSIYLDNILIGTQTGINWRAGASNGTMAFGGFAYSADRGDQCNYLELRGLRVYE